MVKTKTKENTNYDIFSVHKWKWKGKFKETSLSFPPPGMTAIPCACLGIFLGGLLVKKLNLSALGAVRMAMLVNLVSTACYVSFLFLGCDTGPVAGVTVAYSNE